MLSLSLSMPLPATSIFLYSLPLLLAAHLLNVRRQRYAIRAELEALFGGRYALSEADEQRGLKRMTESGLRGVRDAQVRPACSPRSPDSPLFADAQPWVM